MPSHTPYPVTSSPQVAMTSYGGFLPTALTPAAPSVKAEAERIAALLPEVAQLVASQTVSLPAAELLSTILVHFRKLRRALSGAELADLVPASPTYATTRRDELTAAGLLVSVRTDTLGSVGYQPAPHLWLQREPAMKAENRPAATSLDRTRQAAPALHATMPTDFFRSTLGVRRT